MTHILAIDQGTTSTRAIVYDAVFDALAQAQEEFTQHYPRSGWVEHDPMDLWQTTQNCITSALRDAATPATAIAAIGITNQAAVTSQKASSSSTSSADKVAQTV